MSDLRAGITALLLVAAFILAGYFLAKAETAARKANQKTRVSRRDDDFDMTNPAHPLSPCNPSNPASPLFRW